MEIGFSEGWACRVVEQLKQRGVEFAPGFGADDIAHIGDVFRVDVPVEFALFLRAGVPTTSKWARWIDGPEVVADAAREWIEHRFEFDIRQGQYWHPLLGKRPDDDGVAVQRALRVIGGAPPLLPIYADRYLATSPAMGRRAVLSVWQPIDSIFYGNDLADYFACEFHIERPSWAAATPPPVPVWDALLDLFCVGQ